MSAVLKFSRPERIGTSRKGWPDEIARPDKDEREEVQEYARNLAARYERDVSNLQNHARLLGEHAMLLQAQAEERERAQAKTKAANTELEQKFRKLVDEWRKATKHISSVDEMVLHPNYLKIIAMGESAIPLLLRELKERPDHWLVALHVLTDQDPAQPEDTFYEAVQAWLAWGRRERHIS